MSELYLFENNNTYRGFTPTVFSKIHLGITYVPTIIIRSGMNIIDNFAKSPVNFRFDRTHSYARELLLNLPETPISVTIYRNSLPYWKGTVLEVKANPLTIEVSCDSLYTTLQKGGLPVRTSLLCRHTLYGADCGVIKESYKTSASVIGLSGRSFSVASISNPDGYFSRGMAEINGQTRSILEQIGQSILLSSPFVGVQSGTLNLYPGCDLTQANCITFNNLKRMGAEPYLAPVNPFSSTGAL